MIDAHVHFWRLAREECRWIAPGMTPIHRDFGPEDLRPHLERNGVTAIVAVQAAEAVSETEFLLDIAARTSFVAGVVGWAPFESRDGPDVLSRLAADPYLKAVRPMIQDIADDGWMLDRRLTPMFEMVIAQDVAFDALVYPRHLSNLMTLIERHPDMRVIVDHGAKPRIRDGAFDPWAAGMKAIADNSPAFVKLSGLVTEAGPDWSVETLRPYVDHLIACFGPARVAFGSDWPVVRMAADYDPWFAAADCLTGGLTDDEKRGIFGANAARFYRL